MKLWSISIFCFTVGLLELSATDRYGNFGSIELSIDWEIYWALIMTSLSKYFDASMAHASCKDIIHPHTDSCLESAWYFWTRPFPSIFKLFLPILFVSISSISHKITCNASYWFVILTCLPICFRFHCLPNSIESIRSCVKNCYLIMEMLWWHHF